MADVGRGTTPLCTIETEIDLTTCEVIYLTAKQGSNVVFEKEKDDLDVTSEAVSVELTQEETLGFDWRKELRIQIRARYPNGKAVKSNIMVGVAGEILKEGVI